MKKFRKDNRPLLLGLSGGPDSLSLFYLLIQHSIPFSVAHVDHRWREESEEEAKLLAQLCAKHKIKFYLQTLVPEEIQGNLEEGCREKRLAFFREIYQNGFQALLLGHHAGDQAETVLKRLFEGSGLPGLASMQEVSSFQGMVIWRPLLSISKEEILLWLKKQNKTPFEDSTNQDKKFLRPRMRQEIIPFLENTFGKNISNPLSSVANEAKELNEYMEEKFQNLEIQEGFMGSFVDLTTYTHPFELKYLIRKTLRKFDLVLSREELSLCSKFILEKSGNKRINQKLYLDRGILFFFNKFPKDPLKEWQVSVAEASSAQENTDWRGVWQGRAEISLPLGEYTLGPSDSRFFKRWTGHKVPAFLRDLIPVIWKDGEPFSEFLSGKPLKNEGKTLRLTLKYRDIQIL